MNDPAKRHTNRVAAALAIILIVTMVIGCSGGSPQKPVHNAMTENAPVASPTTIEPAVPAADTPVRIEPAPAAPKAEPR